jgi:hypothetical protein
MINQIEPSLQARSILRGIDKGLNQARRIQARLKLRKGSALPENGTLWSPMTGLPATVRVSRWIE